MKNVMSALTSLLIIFTISSCTKEKEDPIITPSTNHSFVNSLTSDYLPDNDSSYWIYEVTRSDSMGLNTTLMGYDTMLVTNVNLNGSNYKFYKFEYYLYSNPGRYDSWYMKDTLGSFINENGKTMLDINAMNSVVRKDTIVQCYYYQYKMLPHFQTVVVPSGTYTDVVNYQVTFQFSPCQPPNGMPAKRVWDRLFAKNVGLIYESYGLTGDVYLSLYERKLVSYNLRN